MLLEFLDFGWPQAGALLVLVQRGLEEMYSNYNTKRLLAAGGVEKYTGYYRVVMAAHLSWLLAVLLLMPGDAPVLMIPLAIYLGLQIVRYWVIASLGRYWTHRIVTLEGAPLVHSGPYRYLAHPNYIITILEIVLLPMIFGGFTLGLVIGTLYAPILYYKIVLEDRALAPRRSIPG